MAVTFLRVAELGSFSRAAEQLGYSQAAVTVQMKQLERELGTQLFERIGRRIRLTEDGAVHPLRSGAPEGGAERQDLCPGGQDPLRPAADRHGGVPVHQRAAARAVTVPQAVPTGGDQPSYGADLGIV